MMAELRKYNASTTILFPLIDAGASDFESTPVTFASGDAQVSLDEGAFANTTNLPSHEGNGIYSLVLTAAEMSAARVIVTVIDQTSPKAWEDQAVLIETYGNASAQHAVDLSDGVRMGLTALPNAAADAAGGLPISDAGGLDLDTRLGHLDADVSSRLAPTTASRTLDVTAGGCAGVDWGNLENASATVDLSATSINLCDTVTTASNMRGTDNALTTSDAPANFADLAITATTGKVTVGTNDDKTGYQIAGSITTLDGLNNFDPTTDTVTVGTNSDKTGYQIAGSITTLDGLNNFDPTADTVTVGTNNDKTGYHISGSITTLDGLNNFDPANDTVANVDTVATLTSHTPQSGDSYARIGAAGASLTNLGGMSTTMKSQVQAECNDAIVANNLDAQASPSGALIDVTAAAAGSSTTAVATSAISPSFTVTANQFKDRYLLFDADTTTTALRGVMKKITANTGGTATPVFTVNTMPATPADGDKCTIV